MKKNLVTARLVITATIALLLLVPLSATSQATVSSIAVNNADAKFDASMSTNPDLESAIKGVDKHTLAQGASAVLDRSLKALPSGAWERHPKVVSLTGADSMLSIALDMSQIQARPAIGPNTRIQVQGADDIQSFALAKPFVAEVTSAETSTVVPDPADTPSPTETDIPSAPTDTPSPLPTETPMPTQTDTPPSPTETSLPLATETQTVTPVTPEPPTPNGPPGLYIIIGAIITSIIGPLIVYYIKKYFQETSSQSSPSGRAEGESGGGQSEG